MFVLSLMSVIQQNTNTQNKSLIHINFPNLAFQWLVCVDFIVFVPPAFLIRQAETQACVEPVPFFFYDIVMKIRHISPSIIIITECGFLNDSNHSNNFQNSCNAYRSVYAVC